MPAPLAQRMQVKPGQAIVARLGPKAIAGVNGGAVTWIADPTKTSGVETDLTRDRGWDAVTDAIDAVWQVAVDDTWSALRFKAVAEVGRRGERRRQP